MNNVSENAAIKATSFPDDASSFRRTPKFPEHMRLAMLAWAEKVMVSREPDFILHGYMDRWYTLPRGDGPNLNIHRFRGNDMDRALHDHPYDSTSYILQGSYLEFFHREPLVCKDGKYEVRSEFRAQGDVVERSAGTCHRVGGISAERPVITAFFTGPRVREWGFLDPVMGWTGWRDYERAYPSMKEMRR